MTTVKNLLQGKGSQVFSVIPDTSVRETLKLMAEKGIGAVVILENDKILGIFSERDYARRVSEIGDLLLDRPVGYYYTHPVYFVDLTQTLEDCMSIMTAKRIRHLPVVDNNKLVGLISIGDVVKAVIADKETSIKGLENYIYGHQVSL